MHLTFLFFLVCNFCRNLGSIDFFCQPWELGKKYNGNFIFTFATVRVRCGSITSAKILNIETIWSCLLLLDCYIESLWQTHGKQTIITTSMLNKIMCNSKICMPFNVCMKDKKYSRKINYLPYLVDNCL